MLTIATCFPPVDESSSFVMQTVREIALCFHQISFVVRSGITQEYGRYFGFDRFTFCADAYLWKNRYEISGRSDWLDISRIGCDEVSVQIDPLSSSMIIASY